MEITPQIEISGAGLLALFLIILALILLWRGEAYGGAAVVIILLALFALYSNYIFPTLVSAETTAGLINQSIENLTANATAGI